MVFFQSSRNIISRLRCFSYTYICGIGRRCNRKRNPKEYQKPRKSQNNGPHPVKLRSKRRPFSRIQRNWSKLTTLKRAKQSRGSTKPNYWAGPYRTSLVYKDVLIMLAFWFLKTKFSILIQRFNLWIKITLVPLMLSLKSNVQTMYMSTFSITSGSFQATNSTFTLYNCLLHLEIHHHTYMTLYNQVSVFVKKYLIIMFLKHIEKCTSYLLCEWNNTNSTIKFRVVATLLSFLSFHSH